MNLKVIPMGELIYDIGDRPKTFKEWFLYGLQQVLAVFVATVLIATICGTPISSCLFGACVGTLIYQLITKFQSPMFISSCGATCGAVIAAIGMGGYAAVVVGGAVIFATYCLFALVVKLKGVEFFNHILPPIIIGPITMVIGLNLATFIPTYVLVGGEHSNLGIVIAIVTMIIVAITSHYFKGFWKTIPFLIGLLGGYVICMILTLLGIAPLIDFSLFKDIPLFAIPDFTFKYWDFSQLNGKIIGQVALVFLPVAVAALSEHTSDHLTLSNIISTNLTKKPGLDKTLVGDGLASWVGTVLCGLPNTSYGESIATVGFSRVASVAVLTVAALMLGVLSFFAPLQAFIASIPSCVFGGCAMILYGYIAASGLKTLIRSKVDLNDNRNLVIVSVILTTGVSGIWLFHDAFSGVSLAMILGILLNFGLKEQK